MSEKPCLYRYLRQQYKRWCDAMAGKPGVQPGTCNTYFDLREAHRLDGKDGKKKGWLVDFCVRPPVL